MAIYNGLSLVVLATTVLFATVPDISITGTVTDSTVPLAGAIVCLVSDSTISDTSGADGAFKLSSATAILTPHNLRLKNDLRIGIRGKSLLFTVSRSVEKGVFSLYSGNGQRVMHSSMENISAQTPHLLALPLLRSGFYMLSISIGDASINRTLILIGSELHLDYSGNISFGTNEIKKLALLDVDKLKVKKTGYITKTVDITSYKIENIQIILQKGSSGPCDGGKWATTDVTKTGPFETVSETVEGGVLYRPKNMLSCLYPVITWGHGAGGSPSNYTTVLNMIASHGFVVIASSAGNVQDGGTAANQFRNKMVQAAEWVVKQNSNSASVLYQKIDTTKIGAAGHSQGGYGASESGQNPLIRTSVSISGAIGSTKQKGPAFIICGGKDLNSGARCEDHPTASYNGTSGVPVFMGKCLNADHGNWGFEMMLTDKTKPSDIVQATTAWFRYFLMGDEAYRSWFYGADCHLCKHSNWSVQSKGMN